jgi:DNA invertase Pin-like site-specific DNA recombinase
MVEVVIYIRTSTDDQNPANQLADCEKLNVWGEYIKIEDMQSAWKDTTDRKEFNELIKLIKTRKVKHLIVWDLDRIYRNRLKLSAFFELCKINGCLIHSFRQGWLESINQIQPPFNDIMHTLMLSIMGWLAEEESTKKSERVKAAIRVRDDGAYSYKGNKWGRDCVSKQKQHKIEELYIQKKSMRQIALETNLSLGVVHKYIQIIKGNKQSETSSSKTTNCEQQI